MNTAEQADMAWRVAQRKIFMDKQDSWIAQWEQHGVSAETLRLIEADQVQTRIRLAANKAAREAKAREAKAREAATANWLKKIVVPLRIKTTPKDKPLIMVTTGAIK